MHQIISTIKERSFFIIVLLFLLNLSCEQNQRIKLKQQDPKNGFNADLEKVAHFKDLTRHLEQYDSTWKKIIPSTTDFEYVKDMASELTRIQNKGTLGKVPEGLIFEILRGIPEEGRLREAFLDMWLDAQGKSITKK